MSQIWRWVSPTHEEIDKITSTDDLLKFLTSYFAKCIEHFMGRREFDDEAGALSEGVRAAASSNWKALRDFFKGEADDADWVSSSQDPLAFTDHDKLLDEAYRDWGGEAVNPLDRLVGLIETMLCGDPGMN